MMLKGYQLFTILVALTNLPGSKSFLPSVQKGTKPINVKNLDRFEQQQKHRIASSLVVPRGGALEMSPSSIIPMITSSLQSGPYGVLALSAVTWSVVLPLTLFKKVYGIGVAYGFSVAAAGYTMLQALTSSNPSATLLAKACMFYGIRLGSYLLIRDKLRDYQTTVKNGSVSSRITFSASLSLFYAFLVTPVLYAFRSTVDVASNISLTGAYLAWFGASLEAIADLQKLVTKQMNKDSKDFVGPTTWTYRICRHPNYLGEVLFWTGLFVGGVTSLGKSIPAWVASSLGLLGIVSIMFKATEGLEKRQADKYEGQEKYDTWKQKVKSPLIPFFKSE